MSRTGQAVLASGNAGKLRELARLLAPLAVDLRAAADFGAWLPRRKRDGPSSRTRSSRRATPPPSRGSPRSATIPDWWVSALDGAPGIYSSRFAGTDATAAENNAKLVAALDGIRDRRAHFYCALVFLQRADDPAPLVATGAWHGMIVDRARGARGFGYDPHFYLPDLDATAAELAAEDKNARSHRGIAARDLAAQLAARPAADP